MLWSDSRHLTDFVILSLAQQPHLPSSDSRCSSCWLRLSQPPSMVPHALSLSPSLCSLAFLAVQLVEKQNHFQCWSLTFSDPFL